MDMDTGVDNDIQARLRTWARIIKSSMKMMDRNHSSVS